MSRKTTKPKKKAKRPPKRRPPKKLGRPSEFKEEFCQRAKEMYEQGAVDIEVADALGIAVRTLYRWQAERPDFCQAAKVGKAMADARVERSLYHRAVGYTFDTVKIMQNNGLPVVVPFREHVPPDPGAAFNWLKNRKPEEWRDRRELTGADGKDLPGTTVYVIGKEEAKAVAADLDQRI